MPWHVGSGRKLAPSAPSVMKARSAYVNLSGPGPLDAGQGDGGHKELRVWMVGLLDDEFHVAGLDNRTAIQHDDISAALVGCHQIVGQVKPYMIRPICPYRGSTLLAPVVFTGMIRKRGAARKNGITCVPFP